MHTIEISGLRKTFRRLRGGSVTAVDGLDLHVPRGSVFGFLGPNGSGKTTTIRCMLALARPDSGSCTVLGADSQTDLAGVIGRIGSVVEAPTFFGKITGRRHLEVLARAGGFPRSKIDMVLDRVGLASRAKDRIKSYSLGMKQRLALAAVLLKDPELLVLDEPGNGLDPAGIKELRDVLQLLAAQGRTVFVSSHLLSEVQVLCDHVGIIQQGRCIASGTVDEIVKGAGEGRTLVRAADPAAARVVLAKAGMEASVDGDHVVVVGGDGARVNRVLARGGIWASEIRPASVTLEAAYLELTGGESGD